MEQRYQLAGTAIIHEFLDNEVIIANLDSGNYYSLRENAISVWQLLIANHSVEQIVDLFTEKFPQEYAAIKITIISFVEQLVQEGLLRITETNIQVQAAEIFWSADFVAPSLEKYEEMKDLLMLDPIHEVDEQGWPSKTIL